MCGARSRGRPVQPAPSTLRASRCSSRSTTDAGLQRLGRDVRARRRARRHRHRARAAADRPRSARRCADCGKSQWDATFGNGFAVGGTDIALHDLCGKALGVPVHQLYGGAQRERVPVYASGHVLFPGRRSWHVLGRRGVRPGAARLSRDQDAHRSLSRRPRAAAGARVREALPAHVKLMVDAWGSYTPPTALRVGRELERLGVYWYEEPLPQAGYAGYLGAERRAGDRGRGWRDAAVTLRLQRADRYAAR